MIQALGIQTTRAWLDRMPYLEWTVYILLADDSDLHLGERPVERFRREKDRIARGY